MGASGAPLAVAAVAHATQGSHTAMFEQKVRDPDRSEAVSPVGKCVLQTGRLLQFWSLLSASFDRGTDGAFSFSTKWHMVLQTVVRTGIPRSASVRGVD